LASCTQSKLNAIQTARRTGERGKDSHPRIGTAFVHTGLRGLDEPEAIASPGARHASPLVTLVLKLSVAKALPTGWWVCADGLVLDGIPIASNNTSASSTILATHLGHLIRVKLGTADLVGRHRPLSSMPSTVE
jgi:hypothetical protein